VIDREDSEGYTDRKQEIEREDIVVGVGKRAANQNRDSSTRGGSGRR